MITVCVNCHILGDNETVGNRVKRWLSSVTTEEEPGEIYSNTVCVRGVMFTNSFLSGIRRKALRRGIWYSALDRVERGILVLTSRVVEAVRSVTLCVEIVKILAKLRNALKSRFAIHMESYGLEKARKIAAHAVAFGDELARTWAHDFVFVRYLTFMDLNRSTGWGVPSPA